MPQAPQNIDLSIRNPPTLLNSVAKEGRGDALRTHFVFEGLEKLIRVAASEAPVPPFERDILRRIPEVLPKLGRRAFDRSNLREVILADARLSVFALATDFSTWTEAAAPLVLQSPELCYHFVRARNRATPEEAMAPFYETIRRAPFWLARLAKDSGNMSLLSLSLLGQDGTSSNPYQLLHRLVSNPSEKRSGAWSTLFKDPVVAVLSARFFGEDDFPWDYLPFSALSPRDATNLIRLWPHDSVPTQLWDVLVDDPEWFVEAWTTQPSRRPHQSACGDLLKSIDAKQRNVYAFATAFCEWWNTNIATLATGQQSGGAHDEGMVREN